MAENELQILINGIFSCIKEKYGYTDEQALIYLKGYEDCAEEHQQSLEKRDKMLRDTVAELREAKRLLKVAVEDLRLTRKCQCCKHQITGYADICYGCHINTNKWEWRYADEALKLIEEEAP